MEKDIMGQIVECMRAPFEENIKEILVSFILVKNNIKEIGIVKIR